MEENKNEMPSGEIKIKEPLGKKLENFWYHYKWHSIIAAFLVVTVLICSLQMCRREKFDTYVLYAGSKTLSRATGEDGMSDYMRIVNSLYRVTDDFDGDGEVAVSLLNYLSMTKEEIEEAKENLKEGEELNLIYGDSENLRHTLLYSEYYVCFLSVGVYEQYKEYHGVPMFVPLADYTAKGRSYDFYDESAIKLSSPALERFRALPGICDLDAEDTLICLRAKSELANSFGSEKNSKNYDRAKEVIKNILAY